MWTAIASAFDALVSVFRKSKVERNKRAAERAAQSKKLKELETARKLLAAKYAARAARLTTKNSARKSN